MNAPYTIRRAPAFAAIRALTLAATFALLFSACSLAPRYERPEQDIPEQWRKVDLGAAPLNTDWWTRFNDPVLTALVEESLKNNQDLAGSLAKIDSAAAQVGVATSALFPYVSADGGASSQSSSTRVANYSTLADRTNTNYQGSFNASWELDFWGKYRNNRTMLSDVLMNSVVGHEALRLSVAGQTAQGYFALLALDMQLDTARRTLKSREDAFGIYTSRYKQGDITELDWQRARAEVETARAQVHTSTVAVDQAEAALAVLLGRSPRDIINSAMPRGKAIGMLPSPPVLPAGLPSELLERRPDVRAAEYLVMAYNANIGVARARFFPSISLTGMLGTLSAAVGNLFINPSAAWSYGASGTLPILDFGNNWYNLKDAEAQKKAAIAVYLKTVQMAFQDIRTSLTSQREADAIVCSMQIQVKSLCRAVDIARLQYDNGYTDYLTVLDAERQLFSAELQLASALRDRLNAVVSVCMSLGGGWADPDKSPSFLMVNTERLLQEEINAGKTASAAAPALSGN
ncbi:efflux transporter outer membrane subunit [uncultured Desulfovibrio sp.]|uniref:efflux transporter outer membrane subunit n=1 Tax=uncultured Desulfovibrio sp. TaxID=167968 RepID=UPI00262E423F|nr:efflux transporter outer membrane subunit [uncultured Desulfovibrio sp.]